ncbi:hypothetical protein [Traorella massiliensis]|uniref:hypothetical protein n=1 Tax=Traorella massiliensis TaxID=1903263 RepID=UPI002353B1B5|nr:hypothetical protein [Traorella massiliensis]
MKKIESNLHVRILMGILLLVFIMILISFSIEINANIQNSQAQQEELIPSDLGESKGV